LQIVNEAKKRGLDPRLVLAIMKQESQFKPNAKSPSAARGLLQLTLDAAQKYAKRAGVNHLTEDSLYVPGTSIALGCEYLGQLSRMFAGLPEAIAASYNGGEDNVARWLARSNQNDEGVFAAEVGFSESKDYVFKVMAFYRAYRQLYDASLKRRQIPGQGDGATRRRGEFFLTPSPFLPITLSDAVATVADNSVARNPAHAHADPAPAAADSPAE
jgi:soluble lytic murein transglycosylase